MHQKGIAHRDMKLENLLLTKEVSVKIADFGLIKKFVDKGVPQPLQTRCGTINYMSPELLASDNKSTYDGPSNDIFACGVMLFMILTCLEPFKSAADKWYVELLENPK
jgi:serine/threonine protein kinase